MQVSPVSYKTYTTSFCNSQTGEKKVEISNPFLFQTDPTKKMKEMNNNSLGITVSLLAVAAVAGMLLNLRMKNIIPESLIELADKNAGLNKLKYTNTAKFLKKKVLYPIRAAMEGDEKYIYGDKLKSGLILTVDNKNEGKKVINALVEHAKEIGIYTMEIPANLKRNGRIKWVYKAIEEATNYHRITNGDYTIINIGDISNLANLKISKTKFTNVEEKLRQINKQSYPGVIWVGYTDAGNSLPYFYTNAPILITKLAD